MRITSKGQVTIPVEIHQQAGLLPHTEVDFDVDGRVVRIIPAAVQTEKGRGRASLLICADAVMLQ
jgi:bifunctional DNA-binding transcriptional regulator/antitoxin component of YhaV-PrlF toxin-antitoxin module